MTEVPDRYVGYYEALDRDEALREEARQAAAAVAQTTAGVHAGERATPLADVHPPRPK